MPRAPVILRRSWVSSTSGSNAGSRPCDGSQTEAQRFAAIVQLSHDAIITKDLNGIITSWNPTAERIFGYSAEEVVGQSVLILIPPERHDEELVILDRIRHDERIKHYETIRFERLHDFAVAA